MSLLPKRISFKMVIWVIGILMALVISGWPLVYEQYVRRTWQRIPCYKSPDKAAFDFEFNGKFYHCGRLNFWNTTSVDPTEGVKGIPPNDFCYVNGATPPSAVLRLDALQHPEDGVGHFTASAMVLAVCTFISFRSRRSAAAPHASS